MSMLTVLNVGQGDSCILSPGSCRYGDSNIFVDVGRRQYDVFGALRNNKRIVVLLSHAHNDHIGGLSFLLKYIEEVDQILLPLYFDEINAIYSFICKLRGVEQLRVDDTSLEKMSNHFVSARLLEAISNRLGNKPVTACCEGCFLCKHISIHNPPADPAEIYNIKPSNIDDYRGYCSSTNYRDLRGWFDEDSFERILRTILTEGWSYDYPRLISSSDTFKDRLDFIWGFIYAYRAIIDKFVKNPSSRSMARLYRSVEMTSNDASVIMCYNNQGMKALFTGDVSKKALAKLLQRDNLPEADILKIPHHGSKHSISKKILRHINPQLAIVSHDNGKFGRQRDPHPHKEVVDMLNDMSIKTLYTNDVIKDEKTIAKRPDTDQFSPDVYYKVVGDH